jgi:transposase
MGKRVKLREVSEEEREQINRLAKSRTQPARLVQRAQIIQALVDDPSKSATKAAHELGYGGPAAGSKWVQRFNERGIAGLDDEARSGRPPTHTEAVRSQLIAFARQKPASLELPFKLWTLERLQREFEARTGIHLSDSTIWEWLEAEGLEWKRQESWFHDAQKQDSEFVEKRGR